MTKTLPNAILIGVQKGGTTALYDWLAQHPDIYGDSAMKDFPFYCKEGFWDKGLDWFSRRFSGNSGEPVILHGYVNYLSLAAESAALIYKSNPDTKVFAVLRNPCDRAYSAYLQARKMGRDACPTFERALANERMGEIEGFTQRMDHSYIGHGYYSSQVKAIKDVFPEEQTRFFLFEDLQNTPDELCRALFEFLGVAPDFVPNRNRKNEHAEPKSATIQNIINFGIPFDTLKNCIPVNTRIKVRRYLHEKNLRAISKPELEKTTIELLQKLYIDEISRLEEVIDRDLSAWKNWTG